MRESTTAKIKVKWHSQSTDEAAEKLVGKTCFVGGLRVAEVISARFDEATSCMVVSLLPFDETIGSPREFPEY